ncbi:hypothetical protein WJX82_009856 [Trebouxia sp. C0006]
MPFARAGSGSAALDNCYSTRVTVEQCCGACDLLSPSLTQRGHAGPLQRSKHVAGRAMGEKFVPAGA